MKDRITIEGRDGAFGAYIARPKTLPAGVAGRRENLIDRRWSPVASARNQRASIG